MNVSDLRLAENLIESLRSAVRHHRWLASELKHWSKNSVMTVEIGKEGDRRKLLLQGDKARHSLAMATRDAWSRVVDLRCRLRQMGVDPDTHQIIGIAA